MYYYYYSRTHSRGVNNVITITMHVVDPMCCRSITRTSCAFLRGPFYLCFYYYCCHLSVSITDLRIIVRITYPIPPLVLRVHGAACTADPIVFAVFSPRCRPTNLTPVCRGTVWCELFG